MLLHVTYCIVLHFNVLYCFELHCFVLYCTALYCLVLYIISSCTVSHSMPSQLSYGIVGLLYCILLYCCSLFTSNLPSELSFFLTCVSSTFRVCTLKSVTCCDDPKVGKIVWDIDAAFDPLSERYYHRIVIISINLWLRRSIADLSSDEFRVLWQSITENWLEDFRTAHGPLCYSEIGDSCGFRPME